MKFIFNLYAREVLSIIFFFEKRKFRGHDLPSLFNEPFQVLHHVYSFSYVLIAS